MRKILLATLIAMASAVAASAQTGGNLCHVYVVDVERARKAFESLRETANAENNSVAEITLNQRDTVRTKKYLKVNGRLYLVGMECRCKERKKSD